MASSKLVVAFGLTFLVGACSGRPGWPIVRLTDAQSKDKGAVCLDGSNPVFYYGKANSTANANNWVLYFKGGGWCYNEQDCLGRSNSPLGSTKNVANTALFGGVASDDPNVNPLMAGWNHVELWYCDGASFSGDRTEPLVYKNTTLYFRGKRILDAVLDTLKSDYNFNSATEVLLSGGSAGGLSTYLHADYVGTQLPSTVKTYKAAPNSGFFALHNNASGFPLYPNELKYVYNMQNSSGGVNANCLSAMAGSGEEWKCIFANYSYAYTTTPMFPLQSSLDSWQMGNIWQGDQSCLKGGLLNCSAEQIDDLNSYSHSILDDYRRTAKFSAAGEGGFLETCIEHVAAQGNNFDVYAINGVTEVDAFTKWYQSSNEPAANHWYLPCDLSVTSPHQCNPTCGEHDGCPIDDLLCQ